MRALVLTAFAAVAAAGLTACNRGGRADNDTVSGVCKPFATASAQTQANAAQPGGLAPASPASDPSAALDDCLHRWGYTLAASADPADIVADATIAACAQSLAGWNQQALGALGQNGAVQAPSIMTGQATNPLAEHHAFAQGRALFYVVQARAGHCPPPPASPNAQNSR